MKRNLNLKMKLQEKILLKDQLMCLKSVGTNEVQSLVRKICKKIKFDKDKTASKLIKYIMNLKIDDVKREIVEKENYVRNSTDMLNKIVRPTTIAGDEYKHLVKYRLENNWRCQKEQIKQRTKHLKGKLAKKINLETREKVQDKL